MRVTTGTGLAVVATVAALLLAGCSGDDADDSSGDEATAEDAGGAEPRGGVDAEAEDGADAGDASGEAGGEAAPDAAADDVVTFGESVAANRQLARTASITLEVADVEDAARAVSAAAARAGGFVQTADVQGGDFGSGFLTLRVPATELDSTLERVGEVGVRVVSSGITTEDLTDQLVDLQARIDNLEALEAELQELLASVENSDANATQLLTVYDRINGVRSDIERLQAQRATAADRVALATINVDLVAEAIAPEEVEPTPEDTLGRAWETTLTAFGNLFDALIWLVVTILPVALAVIGVPLLLLWLAIRALRTLQARRRPTPTSDATPPPPAPTPPATTTSTAPSDPDPDPPHAEGP